MMWGRSFFAILLLLPSATSAAPSDERQGTLKDAERALWSVSQCLVRREPEGVESLLSRWVWNEPEYALARKLAERNGSCLFNVKLKFKAGIFQGPLAAAALARKYDGKPLPDYSAVPFQFSQAIVDLHQVEEWQGQIRNMAMAECVFRNETQAVFRLFRTRPMDKEESEILQELAPALGHCMPHEEGVAVSFSRARLRGYLGEAGYAVDLALATGKSIAAP